MLVPRMSYMGAAIGHFFCYLFMLILSYFLGRKYYPIQYDLKRIGLYFAIALSLFFISYYLKIESFILQMLISTVFVCVFLGVVFLKEKANFNKAQG